MYISITMIIISMIAILAGIISIISKFEINELKKQLLSIKEHGASQSKEQIRLTKKLLKILEKSHPNIFEEITNEDTNNIIDINKCKRSS
tara:strand:+ start:486 stop:755 length:270 start_codon:yes stop_codon:yes gene_type:complete